MKDAKGHGSNPRGAHSVGIDQVGKPETVAISSVHPTYDAIATWKATSTRDYPALTTELGRVDDIRASIRQGLHVDPILVTQNGDVIDGHHRLLAFQAEKSKTVPIIRTPYSSYSDYAKNYKGESFGDHS